MWELRSGRSLPESVNGVVREGTDWWYRWSRTCLMGVVNVTPDSFSDGGLHATTDAAVAHARRLVADGAAIVDIGGESTRPGASPIGTDEELSRVIPVIEAIAVDGAAIVSVDTRRPAVARAAVLAGAHLVNDVTGLRDDEMVQVCAGLGVPAVVMHMQGEPADMQIDPRYHDVVAEVTQWIEERARAAVAAGVPSVIVDPGIGFGKSVDHNLALLRALPLTESWPVLIGASRKRTVQILAGVDDPGAADVASIAVHLHAAHHGVAVVRVHDVAAHRQAFAVDAAIRGADVVAPASMPTSGSTV